MTGGRHYTEPSPETRDYGHGRRARRGLSGTGARAHGRETTASLRDVGGGTDRD